ncbi:unnamed protein product [Closterium sp. NIES-54]
MVERLGESVDVAMGTHGHMAPEILMTGEISSATDVYSVGVLLPCVNPNAPLPIPPPSPPPLLPPSSFGVVLFELITGQLPVLPFTM